jgi:hypothetical protein
MKDEIEGLLWWIAGAFVGGVLMYGMLLLSGVAQAATNENPTIEQQASIHQQYLKATDGALYILNQCGALYVMLSAINAHQEGPTKEAMDEFVLVRQASIGTSLGYIIWYGEYYYPNIYRLDTNNAAIKKIVQGWKSAIDKDPRVIAAIIERYMGPCEQVTNGKEFFGNYIKSFPLVAETWPAFPGREKPPEDRISPSMKDNSEFWRRDEKEN